MRNQKKSTHRDAKYHCWVFPLMQLVFARLLLRGLQKISMRRPWFYEFSKWDCQMKECNLKQKSECGRLNGFFKVDKYIKLCQNAAVSRENRKLSFQRRRFLVPAPASSLHTVLTWKFSQRWINLYIVYNLHKTPGGIMWGILIAILISIVIWFTWQR